MIKKNIGWRLFEWLVRMLEVLLVPQLLMQLNRLFKPGTRRLTEREIAVAKMVFGPAFPFEKVRMDEKAYIGCRRFRIAYVGFRVINTWGPISDVTLIHELVHVWQYETVGAVYIPRALYAQTTPEGYNYGGIAALEKAVDLQTFNYEQQADIAADYFCLLTGKQPRWCHFAPEKISVFERLLLPLQQ